MPEKGHATGLSEEGSAQEEQLQQGSVAAGTGGGRPWQGQGEQQQHESRTEEVLPGADGGEEADGAPTWFSLRRGWSAGARGGRGLHEV